jgi:hypothetical protein
VLRIEWMPEDRKMKQQTLAMASGFERYTTQLQGEAIY